MESTPSFYTKTKKNNTYFIDRTNEYARFLEI